MSKYVSKKPSVYVLEQRRIVGEDKLKLNSFSSLRIARRFIKVRYEEIMYTSLNTYRKNNTTNEFLVSSIFNEDTATLTTRTKDNVLVKYTLRLITSLNGIPCESSSNTQMLVDLKPLIPKTRMVESEIDAMCFKVQCIKNQLKYVKYKEED